MSTGRPSSPVASCPSRSRYARASCREISQPRASVVCGPLPPLRGCITCTSVMSLPNVLAIKTAYGRQTAEDGERSRHTSMRKVSGPASMRGGAEVAIDMMRFQARISPNAYPGRPPCATTRLASHAPRSSSGHPRNRCAILVAQLASVAVAGRLRSFLPAQDLRFATRRRRWLRGGHPDDDRNDRDDVDRDPELGLDGRITERHLCKPDRAGCESKRGGRKHQILGREPAICHHEGADRLGADHDQRAGIIEDVEVGIGEHRRHGCLLICLLYTSDAADERSSVDLGGRRII